MLAALIFINFPGAKTVLSQWVMVVVIRGLQKIEGKLK